MEEVPSVIKRISREQLFGVLATQGGTYPHTTIVSFISADDLKSILFLTPKATRKLHNLLERQKVAFFIDNRSNRITDLQRVAGIEAQGRAAEVTGDERERYEQLFLHKYPELQDFAVSPGNALIRITVDIYTVVQHFQEVTILEMNSDDL
jgi:nitroimidazol reductase NimA-like FMN-containing flavoprotein (pyridoxamine 5'-phosphate oxidase superfamily)